jgi:hypothetical protein
MSAKQPRITLAGPDLVNALSRAIRRQSQPVKWLTFSEYVVRDPKGDPIWLTPAEALFKVKAGCYIGQANRSGRILSIREKDPRPRTLWIPDAHFWDDRSVLHYARDMRGLTEDRKSRETADMWDRMLRRTPPPRRWIVKKP